MDAHLYSRDALASLPKADRDKRLREMEKLLNIRLAGAATLSDFQKRLYELIDDLMDRLGHFLGRWEYDCEVEYWGGKGYMDRSMPDELLLKSKYPFGVELRWGEFDFDSGTADSAG
jgi:hypothetical protein